MRTTQQFSTRTSRMIPVQRRLSAALTGPGMRHTARRSSLGKAAKSDLLVAATGGAVILSLIAVLAMG